MNGYEVGSRAIANQARAEGRTLYGERAGDGEVFGGKVLAVSAGLYRVATLDENGRTVGVFDLVNSPVVLEVDARVTVRVDAQGNATILSSGGSGGSSCFQSYTEWGAFFEPV